MSLTLNAIINPYTDPKKKKSTYHPSMLRCVRRFCEKKKKEGEGKTPSQLNPRGKTVDSRGYIHLYIPEHPSAHCGYIPEHRFLVEKEIERFLFSFEHAHHIDGNRKNNVLSNLIVFVSNSAHHIFHKSPHKITQEHIVFDGRLYE
jgi:Fe-S cluster biosynthesis and repair protein YggX